LLSDNFIIIVYQNASGYTRKNYLRNANFDLSIKKLLSVAFGTNAIIN